MICTTCGVDNPERLTFCQECGQRLAPRVAPPTPPSGFAAWSEPTAIPPAPPSRQRPPAPEVRFVPRPSPSPPPPVAAAPASQAATVACAECGSANLRSVRFCVACGRSMGPAAGQGSAKSTLPEPVPPVVDNLRTVLDLKTYPDEGLASPVPAPPSRGEAIAPVRVVDLGTSEPRRIQRICSRCKGVSDGEGQFCRFCGASLADAQSLPAPASHASAIAAFDSPVAAPPRTPGPPGGYAALQPAVGAPPLGAHAARVVAAMGRLVLIGRDGSEGTTYSLGETTDIGRVEGNLIMGEDRYISPRHARIVLQGGTFVLRDLGSMNGVFVRIPFTRAGAPDPREVPPPGPAGGENEGTGEQLLVDQDLFLVGQQVLRFEAVRPAEDGFGVASENGTLLFGTPASPRHARLTQHTVEGVVRDVFHLRKADTVIGREQGDIVFTDDPFLSRRHCVLRVGGTASARRFTVADLGSSNGTFLRVRGDVQLRHGDHFRIGQQLFRFDT